jgi:hypothetical protein
MGDLEKLDEQHGHYSRHKPMDVPLRLQAGEIMVPTSRNTTHIVPPFCKELLMWGAGLCAKRQQDGLCRVGETGKSILLELYRATGR